MTTTRPATLPGPRRSGRPQPAGPAELSFVVRGYNPAPQGSKKPVGTRTGRGGRRVTVLAEQSKNVKPWRDTVEIFARQAIAQAGGVPMDGPLSAQIIFTMRPPKKLPKNERTWAITQFYGDLDKILRSTFDACVTAGAIADDSRFVNLRDIWQLLPGDPGALDEPGAVIRITRIDPDTVENTTP